MLNLIKIPLGKNGRRKNYNCVKFKTLNKFEERNNETNFRKLSKVLFFNNDIIKQILT